MNRRASSHSFRLGFTVVEMLVVLAIISGLLGISVVAIYRVRAAARETEREQWRELRKWGQPAPKHLPIKILFIGNSYTGTNDLPGLLRSLSRELIIDSQVVGGATLESHWNDGAALQKIKSQDWDFVVLQEQSQRPLAQFGRDGLFYPNARRFDQEIRAVGAITVLYMTWARPDTPGPQALWTDSYVALTEDLRAWSVPAGIAMEQVKTKLPNVAWLADSGGHPSAEGTYLIACAFYAMIYGECPPVNSNLPPKLSAEDAVVVHECVMGAMKELKLQIKTE